MSTMTIRRRPGSWGFGAVVVAAALGLTAAPAFAHNSVINTSPADGAVVTEQPGLFTVTTSDNLLDPGGAGTSMAMQISGPADAASPLYYGDGCATVFGPTLEMSAQLGEPGEYTVMWQAVSTDSHTISGTFSFTWQPAKGQVLAAGSATPPVCGGTEAVGASPPATSSTSAATGAELADVLWIAGAVAAVLIAGIGTLLVVTRKKKGPPSADESDTTHSDS
ncbi:copper resistance protein CopC [Leifsonia sp. A12D58]|uniref:copper resistance CopC family protein n=1 Tax=Leifsonia sp. A12D58 TaxID=3397674 RepID=UPI0039DFFFE2